MSKSDMSRQFRTPLFAPVWNGITELNHGLPRANWASRGGFSYWRGHHEDP